MNSTELLKKYGYKDSEITKIINYYNEKQCTNDWLYNKIIEIYTK